MSISMTAKTLLDLFEDSTARFAERPFLAEKSGGEYRWVTYRDVAEATRSARGGLASLGVKPGDRVALISDNCTGWAITAFAAFGLGAWVVPMYESQLPDEWRFILDDAGATVCVVGNADVAKRLSAHRASLPNLRHVVVLRGPVEGDSMALAELQRRGYPSAVPDVKPSEKDVAVLIYTSGTTGKPKGVMLTHANLVKNVASALQVLPLDPAGERSLAFLPWAHCFGQTVELYMGLAAGSSIAILPDTTMLLADLKVVQPTILFSVPRVWNRVYEGLNRKMQEAGGLKLRLFHRALAVAKARETTRSAWLDLQFRVLDRLVFSKIREALGGRLKYAASGAAALSPDVARFLSRVGITVCGGYGLTETSPIVTMSVPGKGRIGAVGTPLPGVSVKIEPVEGVEGGGEIIVYGHCVMKGYYHRDDETRRVMTADSGFRTGDLGRLDEDGYLYITGRVKEQYKLENGKYVAPAPLEERLTLSPFISQVFIHGANKQHNVALVVLDPENIASWAGKNGLAGRTLEQLCREPNVRELIRSEIAGLSTEWKGYERIADFELLAEAFSVQNGMLTQTLKAKRNAVVQRYGDVLERLYSSGSGRLAG